MADEVNGSNNQVDATLGGKTPKPSDEEVKNARLTKDIADLEAAKIAATAELQKIRAEKRVEKKAVTQSQPAPIPVPALEQELKIDENDPSAKAWLKRIQSSVSPVAEELEKERAETLNLTLSDFLDERPATAKNPEKLKEMMGIYDRIATGRTPEGIRRDLEKSYAATFHKELLDAAKQSRVDIAKQNAIFSDIGVSRGSTDYSAPKEVARVYTDEEKAIIAKWSQSAAFPKIEEKKSS